MNHLINSGVYTLNAQIDNIENNKTIIICGLPRSGTSMVAMLLKRVGVFMGDVLDDSVFEDIELSRMVENDERLEEFVEKRNLKHKTWGWKRPNAYKYAKKLEQNFQNIHYIILFRDIASIAMRRSISDRTDIVKNLYQVNKEYQELIEFIYKTKRPILVVSYEKALTHKFKVVKAIFNFIGIKLNENNQTTAIEAIVKNRKSYLDNSQRKDIKGIIQYDKKNEIFGWFIKSNNIKPSLKIRLNNKEIDAVFELSKTNIPNKVKFKIDISKCNFKEKIKQITLEVLNQDVLLNLTV